MKGPRGTLDTADPVARLKRLQSVAAALVETLTMDDTAEVIAEEGMAAVGAQRAAVWRVDDRGRAIELLHVLGYTPATVGRFHERTTSGDLRTPVQDAVRSRLAVWVESREELDRLYGEGLGSMPELPPGYSLACIPLVVEGRCIGAVAFAFDRDRRFDGDDRAFLLALTRYCAQALERARLFEAELEARTQAEIAERRAEFLSEAGVLLAESLDYEQTLARVAQLVVPTVADWCVVELVRESDEPEQLVVAHADPTLVEVAREMRHRYPPSPEAPGAISVALHTGESQLISDVDDARLEASARDAEHLRMLQQLGLRSAMVVPLRVRGEVLGAITFASAESSRRFGASDLDMAEELARRSALAVENARLYFHAREAIEVRDEFLSIAGHELRTPLSTLKLQVAAAERGLRAGNTDGLQPRIARCARSVDRLERLIDELLDVSRITAGRLRLEPDDLDLAEVVRGVCERIADDARRAGCEIRLDSSPAVGFWDPIRIEQVVANLLTNAIKYGRGQPVDVRVGPSGDGVELVVRDHGKGISAADQARIFDRFERVLAEREIGGFGLGLWIVRQVVAAHGGQVRVDSRPARGAAFTVALPLSVPSENT